MTHRRKTIKKESSPNLVPAASNPTSTTSSKSGTSSNPSNEPSVIGSTNGRMPLEKSKNQISNIQTVSGNFKKKIAANWERVSSPKPNLSLNQKFQSDSFHKIFPTVKLKIPRKAFLKPESRSSVSFKL